MSTGDEVTGYTRTPVPIKSFARSWDRYGELCAEIRDRTTPAKPKPKPKPNSLAVFRAMNWTLVREEETGEAYYVPENPPAPAVCPSRRFCYHIVTTKKILLTKGAYGRKACQCGLCGGYDSKKLDYYRCWEKGCGLVMCPPCWEEWCRGGRKPH